MKAGFREATGITPLHAAARYNQTEICRILLGIEGVNVNFQDGDGWAPLHYAARNAHVQIVVLLLGHPDINVNVKDKRGVFIFFIIHHFISL